MINYLLTKLGLKEEITETPSKDDIKYSAFVKETYSRLENATILHSYDMSTLHEDYRIANLSVHRDGIKVPNKFEVQIKGVPLRISDSLAWLCFRHLESCYSLQQEKKEKAQQLAKQKSLRLQREAIKDDIVKWGFGEPWK
jgi:hypothetical protein